MKDNWGIFTNLLIKVYRLASGIKFTTAGLPNLITMISIGTISETRGTMKFNKQISQKHVHLAGGPKRNAHVWSRPYSNNNSQNRSTLPLLIICIKSFSPSEAHAQRTGTYVVWLIIPRLLIRVPSNISGGILIISKWFSIAVSIGTSIVLSN